MTTDRTTGMIDAFREQFHHAPDAVASAPGRVNLIGDHTDYNDGLVLPMAIQQRTSVAIRIRTNGRSCRIACPDMRDEREAFDIFVEPPSSDAADLPQRGPARYIAAVARHVASVTGRSFIYDALVTGDVPIGAGLSSSAALEVATAAAMLNALGQQLSPTALALLCQAAEHDVGVPCGVMDQLVVAAAEADSALLIDCRDLTTRAVRIPAGACIVIIDTRTRHALGDGAYADRRSACDAARAAAATILDRPIAALRDVTPADLDRLQSAMNDALFRRTRHVVTENARVTAFASALENADLFAAGALMTESHHSLRDDFEVTCDELDGVVADSCRVPGVHGCRMTGGGFGGCAVALTESAHVNDLTDAIARGARERGHPAPACFIARPSGSVTAHSPAG